MHLFDLREPVSTLTHGLGAVAALPATWWLWRRALGDGPKQLALLVYGLGLFTCFGGSAAYHGACLTAEEVDTLRRVDHIGIHLLIAGTYTPIAWSLLSGRMRVAVLGLAWGVAAVGTLVLICWGVLPPWLFTAVYLGAGWGAAFAYREIVREHGSRAARPILLGGVAYSLGAVQNLAGWPNLVPGVFDAHELFHLFVLAGAGWHYGFILTMVATPTRPVVAVGRPAAIARRPHAAHPRAIRRPRAAQARN